jgi:hypothetical protein
VTPDDASASVLTGDDDDGDEIDEGNVDIPTLRGDDEPLLDDAVPLEPTPDVRPDDDG